LGVSRFSAHRREALELVRYLTSRGVQVKRSRSLSEAPTRPELYDVAELLERNPRFALVRQAFGTGVLSRPSNVTGKKYADVSNVYMRAVHSVLTGERSASEAAAALENELVGITGFKTGPPEAGSAHPE
jgi:trehalose/maltose transport system substrate-binding protein